MYTLLTIYIKTFKKTIIQYSFKKIEILLFNLVIFFNNIIKFLQLVTFLIINNYNIKLVSNILKIINRFKAL